MGGGLPAISGNQLIKLLKKDNWVEGRRGKHGITLTKNVDGRVLVTTVPTKDDSLPSGTLSSIIGSQQTRIGKDGLKQLIQTHGLK